MEKRDLMVLIISTFEKGAACTLVAHKTADSKMRKGRTAATRNPYLGRVEIRKTYSGLVMGTSYTNSLTNTAARMGNTDAVVRLRDNWHEPINGESEQWSDIDKDTQKELGRWFHTDKKTKQKVYLKLQRNEQQKGFKVEETLYLDGRLATPEEVADIKRWWSDKKSEQSATQTEIGIDTEHEQHYCLPQLETILEIRQKDRVLHPQELLAVPAPALVAVAAV